jgi:hypothetical protein
MSVTYVSFLQLTAFLLRISAYKEIDVAYIIHCYVREEI